MFYLHENGTLLLTANNNINNKNNWEKNKKSKRKPSIFDHTKNNNTSNNKTTFIQGLSYAGNCANHFTCIIWFILTITSWDEYYDYAHFRDKETGTQKRLNILLKFPQVVSSRTVIWVREDPLEKEMTTHSISLAWEIPWTEEPGGL